MTKKNSTVDFLKQQFEKALNDFEKSLAIDIDRYEEQVKDTIKNGQVQKFEFTVELFWKLEKRKLNENHGVDVASPKQVIRKQFEFGRFSYEQSEEILKAIDARNTLSHVYKKEQFEELYKFIITTAKTFREVSDESEASKTSEAKDAPES